MSPVAAASEAVPQPPIPPAAGYHSPRSRGRWVLILLGVAIAADMVSLLVLGAQRSLLDRGPGGITLSEWQTSVERVNNLSFAEQALYLATLIVFLMWVHRSYLNLVALGTRGLRFTPGWAVGYWFVPVLNVLRSKQILDDLWRATASRSAGEGKRRSLTIFWLGALVVAWFARLASQSHAHSFSGLKFMNGSLMVSHFANIAAAALIYRIVSSVTTRQEAAPAAAIA